MENSILPWVEVKEKIDLDSMTPLCYWIDIKTHIRTGKGLYYCGSDFNLYLTKHGRVFKVPTNSINDNLELFISLEEK